VQHKRMRQGEMKHPLDTELPGGRLGLPATSLQPVKTSQNYKGQEEIIRIARIIYTTTENQFPALYQPVAESRSTKNSRCDAVNKQISRLGPVGDARANDRPIEWPHWCDRKDNGRSHFRYLSTSLSSKLFCCQVI
jgi:hypothetical protein